MNKVNNNLLINSSCYIRSYAFIPSYLGNYTAIMALSINIKNSILLISEKVIVLGIAFITSILMARIAGPTVFGQFSYVTSFVALFIPLCAMGLNNIATKYFVRYPKNNHHFFLTTLFIRSLGALLCISIGSISALLLNVSNEQVTYIITLLLLQSFSLFYIVEYYFLAKKQVIHTLKIRLSVIILAGTAKVIVILNGANLSLLVIIHGMEYMLIGLSYLFLYYRQRQHQPRILTKPVSKTSILGLFKKSKWLFFSGIAAAIYLKIDQVMLAHFHSPESVAYYAAAAKLSEFWYVFPILIANAFNPKLIELKRDNMRGKCDNYKRYILTLLSFMVAGALSISLIVYIFSSVLIEFIYGQAYSSSATILNVHIFATLFIFQRAILSKWLILERNYKFSLYSHGTGALVNIILNLILIPKYGGIGAAWATLLSYIVASFLSLLLTKKTREFLMLMITAMVKWPYYLKTSLKD